MKDKEREDVSTEQPQIKVEVEEEGNDSQSNRAVLDEDLTNFQFEDEMKIEQEVKIEHDDQNTFDVKAMTIGDIEKILQDQSREMRQQSLLLDIFWVLSLRDLPLGPTVQAALASARHE